MIETLSSFFDSLLGLSAEPRDFTTGQVIARALIVFACALVMLRLAHKRFFAQRSALDVQLTLVIASTMARAINGGGAFVPTLVVGFVLVLLHRFVSWAAARSDRIGRMVKGRSTVLIDAGQVRPEALRRHDLSEEDLQEDLRINGVDGPQAVRRATLERNGEVSVVKK